MLLYYFNKTLYILYLFIYLILFISKPFFQIKFGVLYTDRIGHLALNTDLFLRRLSLKIYDNNVKYIFFYSDKKIISNITLLNIYKLHLDIYKNNFMYYIINFFLNSNRIGGSFFLHKLEMNSHEYFEYNNCNAIIFLSKDQINKGNKALSDMFIYNYFYDEV